MPCDILPGESSRWQAAERVFLDVSQLCGFREIRAVPQNNAASLQEVALRNELPGEKLPAKLAGFLDTPDGRQFRAALLGPPYYAAAAELISLAEDFFALLGLQEIRLEIGPGEEAAPLAARLDAMNFDYLSTPLRAPDSFAFFRMGECLCAGGKQPGASPCTEFFICGSKLLDALSSQGVELPSPEPCALYIAPTGEEAEIAAMAMAADLRGEGFAAECGLMGFSPPEQFSCAKRIGARFILFLDADCLQAGRAQIRNMETGEIAETGFGEELSRFFYDRQIMELTGALEGLPFQPSEEE